MKNMRLAIYPGTFDPFTNGHLDVVRQAAALFDVLVVAVLQNPAKQPLFSVPERMDFIRLATHALPNVEVDQFQGLLVEYAKLRGAAAVVRGLRGVADFETEQKMAQMNRHLLPSLVTVFLPTSPEYAYISSSLVKEVAAYGGDVTGLVPDEVAAAFMARAQRATDGTGRGEA
nr:pantetheine-phosphate adenylyltransferase [Alicyclobacillus herbarius]